MTESNLRHEETHTRQQREMAYIGFYIWYVIEYAVRLIATLNQRKAYRNISFEREAYSNQDDANYNNNRRHYEWIKYIRKPQ